MKICVFGLWHLGSVTSACLAKLGHSVIGLDFDRGVIDSLNKGVAPLFEPGLNELLTEGISKKLLSFTIEPQKALKDVDYIWITFDTPVDSRDKADIGFLEKQIGRVSPFCGADAKLIISSQVPVGFTAKVEKTLMRVRSAACSPENLRLGKAIDVFLNPDRIIIGTRSPEDRKEFLPLFSSIAEKLEWMGTESAEMVKHGINSFLAASVCFANEIAAICERVGADAKEVERGLKTESRIGPGAYLSPGVAYSGGTLARDINFLISLSRENSLPSHLIKAVKASNDFHKKWAMNKCIESLGSLKNKKLAILGLTYKPGTSTVRRSLALSLAKSLKAEGAEVRGFDPMGKKLGLDGSKIIKLFDSAEEAVSGADGIIIATQWPQFKNLEPPVIQSMEGKTVIDPNGFIEPLIRSRNIRYFSVGRSPKQGGSKN